MAAPSTVLLASDSSISAWDMRTGTQLGSFKGNVSTRNGVCLLGQEFLVAAQAGKDALHFWTWHKDQISQRCFTVEPLLCVAGSLDGAYVAGGGVSGSIYVWEAASGRMLRSWSAHYKAVSCLAFLDTHGSVLVSGGDDTQAAVWLLSDVLDATLDLAAPANARPYPLYSWSDHTLRVTAICCGQSSCATALVVTASLDRSLKLYSMADGTMLRNVALPAPILSIALDAGEHSLYAGSSDGFIFEISLVGSGASAGAGCAAAPVGAQYTARLEGHSQPVNSLAMAADGEHLASGSDDGCVRVWDLRSRQPVQVLTAPGRHPVTSVLVLDRPVHLAGPGGTAARTGPSRAQPLAPLVKYAGMPGTLKPWEGAAVILDGSVTPDTSSGLLGLPAPRPTSGLVAACALRPEAVDVMANGQGAAGEASDGSRDADMERLRAELATARAAADQWRALHSELHKFSLEAMETG